ncbi:MAG: hypothetical protein ACPG5U_10915 [Planktomarina sp.]
MTYMGMALGAAWGVFLAFKRKGAKLDMLHYGAAFAVVGGILGLIANIIVLRLG